MNTTSTTIVSILERITGYLESQPHWTPYISIILAVCALLTFLFALWKQQEDSRAYVMVRGSYDGVRGFFEVTNTGKRMATDLSLDFDPPLEEHLISNYARLNPYKYLTSIVPGQRLVTEIKNKSDAWGSVIGKKPMPVDFTVNVKYRSKILPFISWRYKDRFKIDLRYDQCISNPTLTPPYEVPDWVKQEREREKAERSIK